MLMTAFLLQHHPYQKNFNKTHSGKQWPPTSNICLFTAVAGLLGFRIKPSVFTDLEKQTSTGRLSFNLKVCSNHSTQLISTCPTPVLDDAVHVQRIGGSFVRNLRILSIEKQWLLRSLLVDLSSWIDLRFFNKPIIDLQ